MNVAILIVWIIAGWGVGFYICKGYQKRMQLLEEMSEVCGELEDNISSFKHPTAKVLAAFPFKTQLSDILFKENYLPSYIDKDVAKSFKSLLSEIEICETVTAKSKIQAFGIKNKVLLDKAKSEYIQKGETSRKLGILFGLLFGILWM